MAGKGPVLATVACIAARFQEDELMAGIEDYEKRRITEAEFAAFLRSKSANRPCEACGADDWQTLVDTDIGNTLGMPLLNPRDAATQDYGVSFLATICNNCSNTKLYWRWAVARWVEGVKGGDL